METRDGGHCYATVECKEGGKMEYTKFDYCKVGGTNEFEDPRIGKFMYVHLKTIHALDK